MLNANRSLLDTLKDKPKDRPRVTVPAGRMIPPLASSTAAMICPSRARLITNG
jgi:hypothetical protein